MRVDVGRRDGYSRPEVPLSFRRGTHQCAQIVVCTGIARPQSARCKKKTQYTHVPHCGGGEAGNNVVYY